MKRCLWGESGGIGSFGGDPGANVRCRGCIPARLTKSPPKLYAMSFRRRNVGLASPSASTSPNPKDPPITQASVPGVRPSPIDGRPTTSTGTQTLDDLLAGHVGLALGNSLLVEENGTTDFAGALLRYYAAEGVVQGHRVHVVGVGEQWGRELPGLVGAGGAVGKESEGGAAVEKEKMKIAWRYERLGEFGAGTAGSRGGIPLHEKKPYIEAIGIVKRFIY